VAVLKAVDTITAIACHRRSRRRRLWQPEPWVKNSLREPADGDLKPVARQVDKRSSGPTEGRPQYLASVSASPLPTLTYTMIGVLER